MDFKGLLQLNESTTLDFKLEEYRKENRQEFIKDVMAMANSLSNDVKRIVVGVKKTPTSTNVEGINHVEDVSSYENIIQDNVEPNINFTYEAYRYSNDITLGIFEIYDNNDRPYMMKKDFHDLKKGEMWIRKGTRNSRVTRADLERIIKSREKVITDKDIVIGFDKLMTQTTTLKKASINENELPSEKEKTRLEDLLVKLEERYYDEKGNPKNMNGKSRNEKFIDFCFGFDDEKRGILVSENSYSRTYFNREQLQNAIKTVREDFEEQDNYYLFEENSERINFYIENRGGIFLEDVKISFIFNSEVFLIAEDIYEKPGSIFDMPNRIINNYPYVYWDENNQIVEGEFDRIRHKEITKLFQEDLRVLIRPSCKNGKYDIKYIINAKNLSDPIKGKVNINIQ